MGYKLGKVGFCVTPSGVASGGGRCSGAWAGVQAQILCEAFLHVHKLEARRTQQSP